MNKPHLFFCACVAFKLHSSSKVFAFCVLAPRVGVNDEFAILFWQLPKRIVIVLSERDGDVQAIDVGEFEV